MYTRPAIYKVFSIFMLISAGLVFIQGVVTLFTPILDSGVTATTGYLFGDSTATAVVGILAIYKIISFVFSTLLSVLMYYYEFAFFNSFSHLVRYELKNERIPFPNNGRGLSAGVMKVLGIILFVFLTLNIISYGIIVTVALFALQQGFWGVIAALIFLMLIFYLAVHYIVRPHAFGDVIRFVQKTEINAEDKLLLQRHNSVFIRGMCSVLFGVFIAYIVLALIAFVAGIVFLSQIIGIWVWLFVPAYLVSAVAVALKISVYGCMYDNLAMTIEHELIKYRMV